MQHDDGAHISPAPSPRASDAAARITERSSRASDLVSDAVKQDDQKPVRCAKFRQQELWAWKPVWSPQVVVVMYFTIAAVFIPLGIVIFFQSTNLYSSPRNRYDNLGTCDVGANSSLTTVKTCTVILDVPDNVTAPSYFYYGLVNFYQNARTYITSRSFDQLRGNANGSNGDCEPLEFDSDGKTIVPCGLTAVSRFNDTFTLCRDVACDDPVNVTSNGIAWDIDRETRFKSSPDFTDEQNALITSEDFMVWMRLSAYRNWKKLYRIIQEDLSAGTYYVRVAASFPVESFQGEKFFYVSKTTWFGGPNEPLGITYIVVGGMALVVAIIFLIKSRATPDLELPPETTVYLEGLVKHPVNPASPALQEPIA